jgi:DNA-binding CsgD family transcriptional regulator
LVRNVTRQEKAARARELRDEHGLTHAAIGQAMADEHGRAKPYASKTVHEWLVDPDGSQLKARKNSYRGQCVDCGHATDGSNGRDAAPERCLSCTQTIHAERNERIFAAWERGDTAAQIGGREGMTETAVQSLVDYHRQRYGREITMHRRSSRSLWPDIQRLWGEGATIREIADALGTTHENIAKMMSAMRAAGIDLPPRVPRWEKNGDRLVALWAEGLSLKELADEFDTTPGAVANAVTRLRHRGYLPYRRHHRATMPVRLNG